MLYHDLPDQLNAAEIQYIWGGWVIWRELQPIGVNRQRIEALACASLIQLFKVIQIIHAERATDWLQRRGQRAAEHDNICVAAMRRRVRLSQPIGVLGWVDGLIAP